MVDRLLWRRRAFPSATLDKMRTELESSYFTGARRPPSSRYPRSFAIRVPVVPIGRIADLAPNSRKSVPMARSPWRSNNVPLPTVIGLVVIWVDRLALGSRVMMRSTLRMSLEKESIA